MKALRGGIVLSVVGALFAGSLGGVKGLEGFVLGLGAALLNLSGLWLGIKLFANPTNQAENDRRRTSLIVLMCFVKMPAFIAGGFLSWKVGGAAPGAFLGAVGLVYFLMIYWAISSQ